MPRAARVLAGLAALGLAGLALAGCTARQPTQWVCPGRLEITSGPEGWTLRCLTLTPAPQPEVPQPGGST